MQQVHSNKCASVMYKPRGDARSCFPVEPPKGLKKAVNHSTSMVHPSAATSWSSKGKDESGRSVSGRTHNSSHRGSSRGSNLTRQHSHKNEKASCNDDNMDQIPKKSRIHCSGPLMPPGGNMEDMLKEHEKNIQEAVRKSRLDKDKTKKNLGD